MAMGRLLRNFVAQPRLGPEGHGICRTSRLGALLAVYESHHSIDELDPGHIQWADTLGSI